jgi:hypothetical protein
LSDPKPKRRFRWLRRLLIAAVVALLAVAIGAFLAVQHLDWIAKFAIHRLFPGVTVELGSLRTVSATRLEVRKLVLKSSKTKEPLLSLDDGSILFRFDRVWRAHLEEVRLERPNLVVSPDLGEALGVQPGTAGDESARKGGALGWAIDKLVLNEGHIRIERLVEGSPSLELDFSGEFKDFGVGGEAGMREHVISLKNVRAMDDARRRLLQIADADLRFTTEELFAGKRLRAVRVGKGSLTLTESLLDFFQPHETRDGETERPRWSVGAADLESLQVTVPNARGAVGRVNFRVSATLRDVGAVGTPAADAEQRVTLFGLEVTSDKEPAMPLLAAAEAEARFTISGLAARQLRELRLTNAAIDLAPNAIAEPMPGKPPASAPTVAAKEKAPPWLIEHVSCNYGTLRLRELNGGALDVEAKFAFDLRNLGTTAETAEKVHEITVWDAQAMGSGAVPFLTLDVGGVKFSPAGLLEHNRVETVSVAGGRLVVGEALQELLSGAGSAPGAKDAGWTIGTLDIAGVRTRVEDKRPGVTDLRFTIMTTLRNVRAGGAASEVLDQPQTVEFANIELRSPLDRSARILSLRTVFVAFTLRDLARKHLRKVTILQPTIFLSQDLFVYMENASKEDHPNATAAATAPAAPAGPGWSIDHLDVKFGRLVVGSGGSRDVGLPLEFETAADNIAVDNLAALELQAVLRIPKQSYQFPDYRLEVIDVAGELRFSYPPEKGEKNLVQKLGIGGLRWRQYRGKDAWVAVTFDASGINGHFGGAAYEGYLNGGFSFFFQDDSPWVGWISGAGVDTASVTEIISPQNFRMTGPLDFDLQLDAFRKEIQRMRGAFHLTEPGHLKIGKLDDLLANIPPDWNALKQSSTRIALETLRDFDYTTAVGDFWFVESRGILNLNLKGPRGSRTFEVALHGDDETDNSWQHGKLGKK